MTVCIYSPSHKFAGVVVDFSSRVSYAVIFQTINTKVDGISKALRYLSRCGVLLNVTGFLRVSWHNKSSLNSSLYVLSSSHSSFIFCILQLMARKKNSSRI